ncbi:hypothetical protein [Pseudofulvimonas gallinarii]|uniref:Uncharacterized protein n=1 Tax=Pseudofulvimonas gallinarii TaxID=634155 RepID=A0A4R3LE47_9GAMM|nr:hypothetical protein EDC25_10992 [Pseudofulvimonas gallinarii]
MISVFERFFDRLSFRHRMLLAWAGLGGMLQLCLPALHAGHVSLWLWWLPLTALGLDLLVLTTRSDEPPSITRMRRRPRRAAAGRIQSRPAGAVAGVTVRATRPPKGLSVTSYSTPSRIGR